jgi:hypothetical protein
MRQSILLFFVLYFLTAQLVLLRLVWWLGAPRSPVPGHALPWRLSLAILGVQVLVPALWLAMRVGWGTLSEPHQADVIVVLHLGFMLGVAFFPVLVLVGAWRGWSWVREFWLRLGHFLAFSLVFAQAVVGHECPINEFERQLRGGDLHNMEGSTALGRLAHAILFPGVEPAQILPYYLLFALLVLISWLVVRPRMP